MADHPNAPSRDYSKTLFLPKTDFPMRAGLPKKEPQILAFWERAALQDRILGKTTNPPQQKGATPSERPKFVLHDGPPYANGNLHIGHALNKVLKDIICRSKLCGLLDRRAIRGVSAAGCPGRFQEPLQDYGFSFRSTHCR